MPSRAPKACGRCGKTDCAQHKQRRSRWEGRPSARARGYDSAWDAKRRRILERDHYTCYLGGPDHGRATHVDHVQPRSDQGSEDESNLRAICRACHNSKSGLEGQRARA